MYIVDTETCGLHGVIVLIQYSHVDEQEIHLHSVWTNPISETLEIIESFCNEGIIGFNLAFDWFHLNKLYNVFKLAADKFGSNVVPEDVVDEIYSLEEEAKDGVCLKPSKCLDLFLHARRGPYQSLMDRKDVRIKKVPTPLAFLLAEELNRRIKLNPVYFERKKVKTEQWTVREFEEDGKVNHDFRNVVLSFAPSSALKALAKDCLGFQDDDIIKFADQAVEQSPDIPGWNPIGGWLAHLSTHVIHWGYNKIARKYAADDIKYTRGLYEYFGKPEPNDHDSILACMVGAIRWKGYKVDIEGLKVLKEKANKEKKLAPRAPNQAHEWISEVMSPVERTVFTNTQRTTLEEVARNGGESGDRAALVLKARKAEKEIELYDKLTKAGRFHASFKIIGTLSGRMSGSDGLNPQGIKHDDYVRSCFPLKWDGMQLAGGDFDSFEVTIAIKVYGDEKLEADVKSGKKIHALFGEHLFENETYDSIKANKDLYSRSKQGVFALIYGGDENTLQRRVGIELAPAKEGFDEFLRRYPKIAKARKRVTDMFQSMRQPGGIGSAVEWHEPNDYIESLLGFRRYFTLENTICKALFDMAQKPPQSFKKVNIRVRRREREQTGAGAVQSALYGAAFAIQSANVRAACNHEIQSTGAEITKKLQCALWTLQPAGIAKWHIMPLNIHDEIMAPVLPELAEQTKIIVDNFIESQKSLIPLIGMAWATDLENWAGKK